MARPADVAVVGAGVMGLATAAALARGGADVVLLEQFELGHRRGSSHGRSRIFRLAYAEPEWVRLADEALTGWRELERESALALLELNGLLELVRDLGESSQPGLEACGVEWDELTPEEVARRFPVRVPEGWRVLLQPEAGVVYAERACAAFLELARRHGARLEERRRVAALDELRAGVIVVAAGAWAAPLLAGAGIELPVRVTRETVAYFRLDDPRPAPAVVDFKPGTHEHAVYALPDPVHGLKVGAHRSGLVADPDEERGADEGPRRPNRGVGGGALSARHARTCRDGNLPLHEHRRRAVRPRAARAHRRRLGLLRARVQVRARGRQPAGGARPRLTRRRRGRSVSSRPAPLAFQPPAADIPSRDRRTHPDLPAEKAYVDHASDWQAPAAQRAGAPRAARAMMSSSTLVLDFDGTITEEDLLDEIAQRFGDPNEFARLDAGLDRGSLTLREVITREFAPVRAPLDEVVAWVLENVRVRAGLGELLALAHARGWRVLVLSSGFVELIAPVLEREGVDAEVLANRLDPAPSGWRVLWRDETVCATCGEECKRRGLPADGEIVYVGDGISDRCAALAADRVFATKGLARYLDEHGVPYERFADFHEVAEALAAE